MKVTYMGIAKAKDASLKSSILYGSHCMTSWNRQNVETVKRSVVSRACGGRSGRQGCIGGAQRVFRAVRILCVMPQ